MSATESLSRRKRDSVHDDDANTDGISSERSWNVSYPHVSCVQQVTESFVLICVSAGAF